MYELTDVYSYRAWTSFRDWRRLPHEQRRENEWNGEGKLSSVQLWNELLSYGWPWVASSYQRLAESVSFLTSMNKRLVLFYRGQRMPKEPLPALYRDRWRPFNGKEEFSITSNNRTEYWESLHILGRQVASIARRFGTPRPRTLELIREAQWAILQHYQLWPTPLIDITQNLRVAATFALWEDSASGYVIVVGMPNTTGSVTYDVDQHIVLARLESVCPPEAKRPHIQNAFLVGRHPLYDVGSIGPHRDKNSSPERQRLKRRLVAVIRLDNRNAGFWDDDFQPVSKSRLYPADDDFHRMLCDELRQEILNRAAELETQR